MEFIKKCVLTMSKGEKKMNWWRQLNKPKLSSGQFARLANQYKTSPKRNYWAVNVNWSKEEQTFIIVFGGFSNRRRQRSRLRLKSAKRTCRAIGTKPLKTNPAATASHMQRGPLLEQTLNLFWEDARLHGAFKGRFVESESPFVGW